MNSWSKYGNKAWLRLQHPDFLFLIPVYFQSPGYKLHNNIFYNLIECRERDTIILKKIIRI